MYSPLILFNDSNILNRAIMEGYTIVFIGEETNPNPAFCTASMLLPPYDAMADLIDENYNGFINHYFNYLSSRECDYFISAIFASILCSKRVALYVNNNDDIGNTIMETFFEYLSTVFGISPEVPQYNRQFSINSMAVINSLNKAYYYELINGYMYLFHHPVGVMLPNDIVYPLMREIRPYCDEMNFESYRKALSDLSNIMHTVGKIVEPAMHLPEDIIL